MIIKTQESLQGYHPVTRWLHIGLAIGASLQLLSSLIMSHPDDHGTVIGKLLMLFHQTDGLIVAVIVLANVIWATVLRGEKKKRQIAVIFSSKAWKEAYIVFKKLPDALTGKSDFISPNNHLSMIIEMFGLLTMAGMASTGTMIWFSSDGGSHSHEHISALMEILLTTHAGLATCLWLYVVGHVFMALMHMRAGHRPFARILPRKNS